MALTEKSLILYGIEIPDGETAIDFQTDAMGPELQATLRPGFYSLGLLCEEIKRALEAADPDNTYTCTVNRTYSGGTQNRITITAASASYFDLLFLTGSRADQSAAPALHYLVQDYTGALFYENNSSLGTALIPEMIGYNYLGPDNYRKQEGIVTTAASGVKDSIIFSTQRFLEVKFMYEPEAKVNTEWTPFWQWATAIKPFDFVPEYETHASDEAYSVTLERTEFDGKGLGYKMGEMLPSFPFQFQTGMVTMRLTPDGNG